MTNDQVAKQPEPMSLLLLSAWCGLVAGLLEVGAIVIRKEMFDANHLYGVSRHFAWLIPVTGFLGVFLVLDHSGGPPVWPGRAARAGSGSGSCAHSSSCRWP